MTKYFFGMVAGLMCLCCLILINFPGRTNKENFFLVYQNPHFLTGFHCHEPLVNLFTCASIYIAQIASILAL